MIGVFLFSLLLLGQIKEIKKGTFPKRTLRDECEMIFIIYSCFCVRLKVQRVRQKHVSETTKQPDQNTSFSLEIIQYVYEE